MFKLIVPNMVPHTDSNREPTDYKSVVLTISSLIIFDSKRLWIPSSIKISLHYNGITPSQRTLIKQK